jgi:hypothetical protein
MIVVFSTAVSLDGVLLGALLRDRVLLGALACDAAPSEGKGGRVDKLGDDITPNF